MTSALIRVLTSYTESEFALPHVVSCIGLCIFGRDTPNCYVVLSALSIGGIHLVVWLGGVCRVSPLHDTIFPFEDIDEYPRGDTLRLC